MLNLSGLLSFDLNPILETAMVSWIVFAIVLFFLDLNNDG